jgi:hypothetical protein
VTLKGKVLTFLNIVGRNARIARLCVLSSIRHFPSSKSKFQNVRRYVFHLGSSKLEHPRFYLCLSINIQSIPDSIVRSSIDLHLPCFISNVPRSTAQRFSFGVLSLTFRHPRFHVLYSIMDLRSLTFQNRDFNRHFCFS